MTQTLQAIILPGNALSLAQAMSRSLHAEGAPGPNHLALLRRCVYAGAAARVLAVRFLPDQVEACFAAALCADLGALQLDRAIDDAARPWSRTNGSWLTCEPSSNAMVVDAISGLVLLAARCADVFVYFRPADSIALVRQILLERFGVKEREADRILLDVDREAARQASVLDVRLNAGVYYTAILERSADRLLALSLSPSLRPSTNQRRSARLRRSGTILMSPTTELGETPSPGRLLDVSSRGLGFLQNRAVKLGSTFLVQLMANGIATPLDCMVTRCDEWEGAFRIGAEFVGK